MSAPITREEIGDLTRRIAETSIASARLRMKLSASGCDGLARHIEGIEDSLDAYLILLQQSANQLLACTDDAE